MPWCVQPPRHKYFNPRSPRGGATTKFAADTRRRRISIHAPHEGERLALVRPAAEAQVFQSTLPTRGSDDQIRRRYKAAENFNPRSPRGGATCPGASSRRGTSISIHAPHEGERLVLIAQGIKAVRISIHAPHEGERLPMRIKSASPGLFQSTLPTRGSDAMDTSTATPLRRIFQSTLPTRGSDCVSIRWRYRSGISIHAPHEGERHKIQTRIIKRKYFNPRSPRGGATV